MSSRTLGSMGLALVLALLGCNAVFDVDDLTYGGASANDGGASSGGAAGQGGSEMAGGGGAGGTEPQCIVEECPGTSTDCLTVACVNNACDVVLTIRGAACATGWCDGTGACVECIEDAQCQTQVCQADGCVEPSCTNGIFDPLLESDVDCGGECGPCDEGNDCLVSDDCLSHFCKDAICAACTSAADCASDEFCQGALAANPGYCTPKQPLGSQCATDEHCASECCTAFICSFPGNCN